MVSPDSHAFLDLVEEDPIEAMDRLHAHWKGLDGNDRAREAPGLALACMRRLWADGVAFVLAHWPTDQPVPANLGATMALACAERHDGHSRERAEMLAAGLLLDLEWERQIFSGQDLEALIMQGPHRLLGLPTVFEQAQDHLNAQPPHVALEWLDRAGRVSSTVHSPQRDRSYQLLARLRHGVLDRCLGLVQAPTAGALAGA